jgi:hypothetical protein
MGPWCSALATLPSTCEFSLLREPETEEEGDLLNIFLEGAVEDPALR